MDNENIHFLCTSSLPACNYDDTLKIGEFYEGLWERDVIEFFIMDGLSGKYQEFNFSPAGAWWTAFFKEYRTPSNESMIMPEVTIVNVTKDADCWSVSVCIKLNSLSVVVNEDSLVHITGISPTHNIYYSSCASNTPISFGPDFHRREVFSVVKLVALD